MAKEENNKFLLKLFIQFCYCKQPSRELKLPETPSIPKELQGKNMTSFLVVFLHFVEGKQVSSLLDILDLQKQKTKITVK